MGRELQRAIDSSASSYASDSSPQRSTGAADSIKKEEVVSDQEKMAEAASVAEISLAEPAEAGVKRALEVMQNSNATTAVNIFKVVKMRRISTTDYVKTGFVDMGEKSHEELITTKVRND